MGRVKIKPDMDGMETAKNPLVAGDFKVLVRKRDKTHHGKGGERIVEPIELEYERYVKVFVEADKRKQMAKIGAPARDLFLWIMYELESGKDYLWINKEAYMKEMDVRSINTYKAAVIELIKQNMIAASGIVDGVYWINPRMFFCGDRKKKYPNNVEEYKPKVEGNES